MNSVRNERLFQRPMGKHSGSVQYGPLQTHEYKLIVYKGV